MEDIAAGVTPAINITPAGDPFVQQLIAENERLRTRYATLERRLARYELAYTEIQAVVQRHAGDKGGARLMKATITDTGGIRLLPECDADRFLLKRLADAGGIYVESVRYDSGPDQRMALMEFTINAKEAGGGTAWKS